VGNRLTASGVTDEWSYNANNELQGYDDVSYEYDENGSITQKTDNGVITKFFYNIEGRLERVEDGSSNVIAEYYYDPFGRRLWKEVSGSTVFFQYADEGLVAEFDGTGTEIKTYGYKPGSTWSTDPLFMKVGSEYYFYHNDHLGTPQKMTAINGAVVWGAQYEAFGKASVDAGSTVVNNLRFPGQYFDDETGLHYNCFRYYDPVSGRYFRPDPLSFGFFDGSNIYAYVDFNPLKYKDNLGLFCTPWIDFQIGRDKIYDTFKRWKFKYSSDLQGGPLSGVACVWQRHVTDYIKRLILPIKFCWDNCRKKIYHVIGQWRWEYDRQERIDMTRTTPAKWVPAYDGAGAAYFCDPSWRFPYVSYPDDFPDH
jgi:RHS repeat-associated protein